MTKADRDGKAQRATVVRELDPLPVDGIGAPVPGRTETLDEFCARQRAFLRVLAIAGRGL
jgi:hypothetical protein